MMKGPGLMIAVVVIVLIVAGIGIYIVMQDDGGTEETNKVSMEGLEFVPGDITVKVGTTVTWTNNDGVTHTVTSNSDLFDSGNIADGGTFSYTFDTVGTYEYRCTLHPGMDGVVRVIA